MTKDKLLETVKELPQNFELDDLFEKLIFIEKVQEGLDQLDRGETITHDEVKRQVKGWRK